jgi:pyruvate dehydrogenase E2 component (dihydrolipoamide acetyltransferase)
VITVIGKAGENIDALLATLKGGVTTSVPTPNVEPQVVAQISNPTPPVNVKATVIQMPKMSDTMTEGTIAKWLKKVGDKVKSGDILAEVETDKATMELENYEDGTLLYLGVEEGKAVAVNGIIAIVGEPDADYKALLNPVAPVTSVVSNSPQVQTSLAPTATPTPNNQGHAKTDSNGRIKASPLAKKLAKEKGIDLSQVNGSGEYGRIVKKDVETFTPSPKQEKASNTPIAQPLAFGQESYTEVSVSQMRKTIARRLSESLYSAPHFFLTMEINMDKAIEARKSINEVASAKVSFNDLIVKASAVALKKHPAVNSSWLGDKIRYNNHVHIGVAMAVDEGLLVPVIRFADHKSLSQIASEVKDLNGKAKNKKLQPADWEGNTFSISNLGMFGIDEFTAIINPPDACILAVGGIKEVPIIKDGQVKVGNIMKVTLSCDHRVVDGATGASFLQTLKQLLEDPILLLA